MFAAGAGQSQAPSTGSGQAYPSRTVRIIVSFAPGGATDVIARLLSLKPGAYMGRQFVIENRPGADALLAMEMVVKVAPDGHTLLMPQLPTVDESGVAGYESGVWYAVFAPAGVPRAIIDRLNADIHKALSEPDVKAGIRAE